MARPQNKAAKYRDFLKERMDPDIILDWLLAKAVLSNEETGEVKSRPTTCQKNQKLLEYIVEKDKEDEFMNALRDADQSHLANYLQNDGVRSQDISGDWPLTENQTKIIDVNCGSLKDLIDIESLVDGLMARRVISHRQKQLICSKATDAERNDVFLEILRRRSQGDYENAIQCLRDTNQDHIAEILQEGGAIVPIHANLSGPSEEVRLAQSVRNLLHNKTPEEFDRIVGMARYKLMTTSTGHSIIFYYYCKTLQSWEDLKKALTSGQLKITIEQLCRMTDIQTNVEIETIHVHDHDLENICMYFRSFYMPSRRTLTRCINPEGYFSGSSSSLPSAGLEVTVRLHLKRKRSDDESPEPDDILWTMKRLLDDGLQNISELLEARCKRRKRADSDPGDLKMEYVEKLVGLMQHFTREVLSVENGSIVVRILCLSRESVWDLRFLCRSEDFLAVCRSALIPEDLQTVIDVDVSLDERSFNRCLSILDELRPPPPSPLGDGNLVPPEKRLPAEMLHRILHETLSAREVGLDVRIEDLSEVCKTWKTVLSGDRFNCDHKRFIEASMKPYLFSPVLLETRIESAGDRPKPIIGVGILDRLLYVARAETPFIEVFSIPDISPTDLSLSIVPDHVLVRTLNVPALEMPFNMAVSAQSKCLYLTDFSQNVGCVWRVMIDGAVMKFADGVGRPIGISISRDNYVIVVSETPNCLRVFSRSGDRVLEMPLDFEAPRQAICVEPGKFALIHGYLQPANRVVELDPSGHVIRCYGSTIGAGNTQIHWPAALIHDSRGRMLVGDLENRRVHLVQRDFRLRRHLVQLDRSSVARLRRLCIDDLNGTLYIGQTDPSVKVYRIAYPYHETSRDRDELLGKGINCFGLAEQNMASDDCNVCLHEMAVRRKLPCNHEFCLDCIKRMKEKAGKNHNLSCPTCRGLFTIAVVPKDNVDPPQYVKEKYKSEINVVQGTDVIQHKGKIMGMTVLGDELFVVCKDPPNIIFKYNICSKNQAPGTPVELSISEMKWPRGIAASESLSCLYVTDWHEMFGGQLWRYKYQKGQEAKQENPVAILDVQPFGVSVSQSTEEVLVTCATPANFLVKKGWIYIYKPSGSDFLKIRIVELPNLEIPRHSILTPSSKLFVCHGWSIGSHGVTSFLDDEADQVRKKSFYGRDVGGGNGEQEMNKPLSMNLDEDGLILVVDYYNHRIQLLTEDLQLVRHLISSGITYPRHVCQYPKTGRMYVSQDDGKVLVFDARDV